MAFTQYPLYIFPISPPYPLNIISLSFAQCMELAMPNREIRVKCYSFRYSDIKEDEVEIL
jgi:hypothetical protein